MVSIGSIARYGLVGATVATVVGLKPNTKGEERFQNKMSTAATLGLLATAPSAAKYIVSKNPDAVAKAALKTGKAVEKVMKYAADKLPGVIKKIKNTKIGAKALTYLSGAYKNLKKFIVSKPLLKEGAAKVVDALRKFVKAPAATKGKYALIAAGVGLLAYAAHKTIAHYYKKEGAIEQKYANK